jgi:DNA-binding XRE family transcriptional regulator
MAGISPKTIYLLEQGKGNASLDTLQKIFDVLGLEMSVRIKKVTE